MLLGTTLALAMVLPYGQLHAEILKNFKVTGEMDLQTTSARNVADFATNHVGVVTKNDRVGSAQSLLLVNAGWDMLDDVHAMVTLGKNDRDWGTPNTATNAHGNGQSQTLGAAGAGNILGTTYVDQAYVKIDKVFGALDATLGRQFYGTQGDMVVYFGPRVGILGMPITALDTLRVDWANDMLGVTGIAGKVVGQTVGTTAAAAATQDVDLHGLTAMLKGHENMMAGAYVYNALTHFNGALGAPNAGAGGAGAVGGVNTNLWVVGVKGKLSMGPVWGGIEAAKDFGRDQSQGVTNFPSNYTGWAAKLDAGLKAELAGLGSVGPWGEFAYGTGQRDTNSNQNRGFTPIAGDYRAGQLYTRFNNLSAIPLGSTVGNGIPAAGVGQASLNNRVIWGLGVKLNPSMWQKLSAGVSYWDYRLQVSPIAATGGTAALSGNKHIGSEANLDLGWKHSENVSFDAGVGRMWPGGSIFVANAGTPGTGTNPATAMWGDVHIKF